ncbi:hypothetical protein Tco_0681873 [Tanacetum coccineum]|uniref:Transposase (putative) gypsy type domain-containing protein n=1 Tax=Tanacetum coccineum TaxID=301880 RepID=A0ABQ4XPK4_9ASTR
MGFPVGSIVWALEVCIGVAMAHSSWVQDRRYFTVIATVKKNSSPTIDKASINHQRADTDEELREFTSEYYIPSALHPVVPAADASIADFPVGKVGVYTRFFEFANQRVPLSLFMCNILNHYRLHISQLHCIGAAKISNFEVNCRLLAINPTVHLFRAFYHTCWSNGWVSFSKRAGRLQCYTEKLDALRRWREMFFWVDDMLVPWNFAFYTQGLLPRDERPPPGSYSIEDAELINENRIPINAYSEAFLCHMGISRNYFQRPEEVPTFIGEDGREMDLFSVVHLSKPKQVTEGVRPLRDGEEPLLESTAGRTMELVLEQPEIESTDVLAPTPLRSVPSVTVEPPRPDATSVGSSEDADVAEVDSGLKRKRATGNDGAGPSKRVRHDSLGLSTSTEEETPEASPTLAAKEVTETHPPQVRLLVWFLRRDGMLHSPHQTVPPRLRVCQCAQLVDDFDKVTAQQAALVAQLRASLSRVIEVLCTAPSAGGEKWHCLSRWSKSARCRRNPRRVATGAVSILKGEVQAVLWDVVSVPWLRGKAEAVEELHERRLPDSARRQYLDLSLHFYFVLCDILNPFALEKEVPLKESLEAHAVRLAKKKGVKGKAILCGVGAAHLPRSDGVPVSVATVSPKDSELLGKLRELGSATQLVGPSKVVVTASRLFFLV